ncbi:MAG: energy transducer TonB [Pseudomonadota bacterium]|nr:energy transducer TonB [Pseudomonadota bacterium]
MKRLLLGLFCILLSGAVLAAAWKDVAKRVEASMLVTGSIIVAPDGSVQSYAVDHPEKLPSVVVGLVGKDMRHWRFEPVLLDGKPVTAKAPMHLRIVASKRDDGNYNIGIRSAYFGRRTSFSRAQRMPPHYPREALAAGVSGTVYVLLRIDRQGHVNDAVVEQVNLNFLAGDAAMRRWRLVLAQATLRAARQWTFGPTTTDETAGVEYNVARVPVRFNLRRRDRSSRDAYGHWKTYMPGPLQPAPWFDRSRMVSSGVDAVPDGGVYSADQSLHLKTPLDSV